MRSAGEIKTELLKLRDLKHLPYSKMATDSRCSKAQIVTALKLEATEDVLRRLDAYLDAKHLHVQKKGSDLLYRIEQMDRELWREYGARTKHILTVQDWSEDRQKRHAAAMDHRLKCLLREKYQRVHNTKVVLPDGVNYWQCKAYVERRYPVDTTHGNARSVFRASAVGKSRYL